MSIDCAIINIDRKQFLRPLDMGLRSEIRSIENAAGLFHVAVARLIEGPWAGDRVAIIHDGGRKPGLPSWEEMGEGGWTNVLPDVIADLATYRAAILNEQYGGKMVDLFATLEDHVNERRRDLEMLQDDDPSEDSEIDDVSRDLERSQMMLSRLRGQEIMPTRWADLLWEVPKPELSCTGLQEQWQTLVWQADDGTPFVFPLYELGDNQFVFYVRERIRVSFAAEGCLGTLRVGVGRADRPIFVSQSAELSGGDDRVVLELPVPRAEDESPRAVPCYVQFVELLVEPAESESVLEAIDTEHLFLAERCLQMDNVRVNASALYNQYVEWSETSGYPPLPQAEFEVRLDAYGVQKYETDEGSEYEGITILDGSLADVPAPEPEAIPDTPTPPDGQPLDELPDEPTQSLEPESEPEPA